MSSQKQIDANRRNALKSTGPRTPKGRAAVRLNGLRHGLSAKTLVLKDESLSEFQSLLHSLRAEHQPSTPTEHTLVVRLVMSAWLLRRVYRAGARFVSDRLSGYRDIFSNQDPGVNLTCKLATVSNSNATGTDVLLRLSGYEDRIKSSFRGTLKKLHQLRTARLANLAN